jgi:hypothetical protein
MAELAGSYPVTVEAASWALVRKAASLGAARSASGVRAGLAGCYWAAVGRLAEACGLTVVREPGDRVLWEPVTRTLIPAEVPGSGERGGPAALPGQHGSGGRLAVHAGYALPLAERGRIEPFGRWTRDGPSGYRLNVGTRLSVLDGVGRAEGPARGLAVSVDLFGEQYASGLHPVQRRLALQGSLRFR